MRPGDALAVALVMAIALILAFGLRQLAHGHEANQPDAAWFNSLQQPHSGIHCCGDADCRAYDERSEVRINDGIYAILYKGEWLPIAESKFLERADNPTGHLVACVHDVADTGFVLCAVKATGT
jgi:hypothetical protein